MSQLKGGKAVYGILLIGAAIWLGATLATEKPPTQPQPVLIGYRCTLAKNTFAAVTPEKYDNAMDAARAHDETGLEELRPYLTVLPAGTNVLGLAFKGWFGGYAKVRVLDGAHKGEIWWVPEPEPLCSQSVKMQ